MKYFSRNCIWHFFLIGIRGKGKTENFTGKVGACSWVATVKKFLQKHTLIPSPQAHPTPWLCLYLCGPIRFALPGFRISIAYPVLNFRFTSFSFSHLCLTCCCIDICIFNFAYLIFLERKPNGLRFCSSVVGFYWVTYPSMLFWLL